MKSLPKIALGAWAWGNDGTFGNNFTADSKGNSSYHRCNKDQSRGRCCEGSKCGIDGGRNSGA